MSRTQVQLRYNWFNYGREDVNDDENIDAVKKLSLYNRRITIREVADMLAYRWAHAKQFLQIF